MVLEQASSKFIRFNLLPVCKGSYEGQEMYRILAQLRGGVSVLPSIATALQLKEQTATIYMI